MEFPQAALIDYVSGIAGLLGLLVSICTFIAVRLQSISLKSEAQRQAQRVKIRLLLQSGNGSQTKLLPIDLPRKAVTRAELLGILGMVPMAKPGSRFSIKFLSTPEFLASVEEAQNTSGTYELVIPVTAEEFEQFV